MKKRTRIVCTIGPASESQAVLKRMIKSGMNVARLNFSHGTYANHNLLLKNIRAAARATGRVVTIMQDLQGPRIRLGEIDGNVTWKKGQEIFLDGSVGKNNKNVFSVTYKKLHKDLKKDHRILIEDGKKELVVTGISKGQVHCKVVRGGQVISHKGMNFPDSKITLDPITAKDKKDIAFGLKHDVDYVVMSFVSNARQLKRLRLMLGKHSKKVGVIAKVEMLDALNNIEGIVRESDGIMIGRGDLALEIDYAEVPIWQKRIIALCRREGKPVIVSTQMMESMMKGKGARPSRADVSDVANAVIDHADAVMTSGETAMGDNPINTVLTMAHIIEEVEESQYDDVLVSTFKRKDLGVMVRRYAEHRGAQAIVVENSPIEVVYLISRARPELPIIYKTNDQALLRKFNLYWGAENAVKPKKYKKVVHLSGGIIV